MVRIKEGYVMSPREKAEFERVDALPRKISGRVDYYFKPETKYPARIYVFMHADIWCDRNRRPMGLYYAVPFLSRTMNREEIEYHHFNIRLCYHQYEDWDKLIFAEEQEAAELDKERSGSGTTFLEKLAGFRNYFSIGKKVHAAIDENKPPADDGESEFLKILISKGDDYTAAEISKLLKEEQNGPKRLSILLLLRELYKNIVLPETGKLLITENLIHRKVTISQDRTRRNLARRVYKQNKLFALAEIRQTYPEYSEDMLLADLRMRECRPKRKKRKPYTDLRRCQLQKLVQQIGKIDADAAEYHKVCNRIVMLQNAHDHRLPIPLTVKLENEARVYTFGWKTRESVVKSFVGLANQKDMTHTRLQLKHEEMVSSVYSY